jgi:hypothetical protein
MFWIFQHPQWIMIPKFTSHGAIFHIDNGEPIFDQVITAWVDSTALGFGIE